MGSPDSEPGRCDDEGLHTVTLSTPFYMGATEVTRAEYYEMEQWAYAEGLVSVDGDHIVDNLDGSTQALRRLSKGEAVGRASGADSVKRPDFPMPGSWYRAVSYCDWRSLREGLPRAYNHSTWRCNDHNPYGAQGYRLPTEAEWEYACRAGSVTAFSNGEITDKELRSSTVLEDVAWYQRNAYKWPYGASSKSVGSKLPNAWGFFDMHGNAWEWCNDNWGEYSKDGSDPRGSLSGSERVLRGGGAGNKAMHCRSAFRTHLPPAPSSERKGCGVLGFRIVRSAF